MSKKHLVAILMVALVLSGCGQSIPAGPGKTYNTYGYINQKTAKSDAVCYEISLGNVVWAIILSETIVMPVYFIGFSLFNPVRAKTGPSDQCGATS